MAANFAALVLPLHIWAAGSTEDLHLAYLYELGTDVKVRAIINPEPFKGTLGWQEHSKNDIRGWHQMLKKGSRSFKIDPNFRSPLFCATQKNFRNKSDNRGCFILNHDNPNPLLMKMRNDYNTTEDVLEFIANPKYARHFGPQAKALFPDAPFRFSLCFKNAPIDVCKGGSKSRSWLSLVDSFFNDAQRLVAEKDLHVKFVLDGDGAGANICKCLKDRWRPWNG
eukprot:jgi/Bigna1/77006/fgenesh1_pg.45_\